MENTPQEEKKTINEPHVTVFGEDVHDRRERHFHHHCHCGGGLWGLIILLVGVMLLLNNSGVVSWQVWSVLALFWPVILVLIGLRLVLGQSFAGRLLAMILALGIIIFVFVYALTHAGASYAHLMPGFMDRYNYYRY